MYFWYKFFTYLFYPFAPFYLYFRILKKKEDSIRYKEKLSKINISRNNGFLIWFHIASVGEAMSILPLVEDCIKEKKIDKILLTSITTFVGLMPLLLEKSLQAQFLIPMAISLGFGVLFSTFVILYLIFNAFRKKNN